MAKLINTYKAAKNLDALLANAYGAELAGDTKLARQFRRAAFDVAMAR